MLTPSRTQVFNPIKRSWVKRTFGFGLFALSFSWWQFCRAKGT